MSLMANTLITLSSFPTFLPYLWLSRCFRFHTRKLAFKFDNIQPFLRMHFLFQQTYSNQSSRKRRRRSSYQNKNLNQSSPTSPAVSEEQLVTNCRLRSEEDNQDRNVQVDDKKRNQHLSCPVIPIVERQSPSKPIPRPRVSKDMISRYKEFFQLSV